ncbi:uncharacterized protein LOC134276153 [Saccostrea cucullata]|uniref:uncharacterized protein LOC134276153 n=1 Tax=Saccostrea cuccullata TaxID=36930 RepID=UPI002ED12299
MSCASQSYGILPPKSSCDTIPIDYVLCRQINMTQNSSTCINEIKDPESRDIFKVPVIVMFIVIPLAVLLAISALTYIYRRRRKIKSKTTEQTNSVKESDIVGEKDETKRGIEERYTERKANESGCDPVYIESYGQYDHLHLKRVHKEKTEKEENHYTGIDTPYQTTSAKNIELTLNEDMYTY